MTRALLLLALAVVACAAPLFVYPVLLMTVLCFVVFACSFNLLLGYAGLLCFGHAMFFGGGAYITGYVLKSSSVPVEVGILAGAAAAAALGYVVGLVAVRRSGIQFAMITFAIAQFVYFLLLQASFTGGEDGMQRIPRNRPARHGRRLEELGLLLRDPRAHGRVDRVVLPDRSLAVRRDPAGDP